MSWEQSRGGQYYTVRAVGTDGHEHECSSNANQCDVTGLHCGQYYTASVTAANTACQSKGSDSVTVKTGMQRLFTPHFVNITFCNSFKW